ncbi:TetR family transcriptional regulator, partial [Streptomyces sp. T-3]|nr:TetR family transcriptional regulator [Streptomyces sp. T-3]
RPALRPVAAEWCEGVAVLLEQRTDAVTARAVVALLDGICLQVLLTGGTYDEAYTREMIGRLMGRAG